MKISIWTKKIKKLNIEGNIIIGILLLIFPSIKLFAQINQPKPNIILILTDDLGWSDVGFNGSRDILTPYIDKLAGEGVIFSNGYVSHPYSSPSRAGIMTGKYQQRFGHEYNLPFEPDNDKMGTPANEVFIAQHLKDAGYRTCAIGKWHLGDHEKFLPNQKGFDHWFGFSGGWMNYWGIPQNNNKLRIKRNNEDIELSELTYLTDDFTNETLSFINENKHNPFFIYLAYNAPHSPNNATKYYLDKTKHIEYGDRSVYAAMVSAVDEGVGRIDSLLTELNIKDNTLIVFLSDNGGRTEGADNRPYRGHKGMLFEGGIRVPFFMTCPKFLPHGINYHHPVISLDLYPTFSAIAGFQTINQHLLDGVNLLPFISGKNSSAPHDVLYWRVANGEEYAVRKGNFKLIKSAYKKQTMLFNLKDDEMEVNDISSNFPNLLYEMEKSFHNWDEELSEPLWFDSHMDNVSKEEETWRKIREESLFHRSR